MPAKLLLKEYTTGVDKGTVQQRNRKSPPDISAVCWRKVHLSITRSSHQNNCIMAFRVDKKNFDVFIVKKLSINRSLLVKGYDFPQNLALSSIFPNMAMSENT
jgi:hypothetical protein